jgi:hypothetical protein
MSKKKNNKVKKRKGESYMDALSRTQQEQDDLVADIMSQINFDAACFAARDVFHMGPSRAPKFKEAMEEYAREICRLVFVDAKTDDELVHSMGKIDEGLLKIVGKENFVAHDIRYGRRIN